MPTFANTWELILPNLLLADDRKIENNDRFIDASSLLIMLGCFIMLGFLLVQQNFRGILLLYNNRRRKDTSRLKEKNNFNIPTSNRSKKISAFYKRIPSSEAIALLSTSIERFGNKFQKSIRVQNNNTIAICCNALFISIEDIGTMQLDDVTAIFQYAIHINKKDFNRAEFLSNLCCNSLKIRHVITQMDIAIMKSRSSRVQVSTSNSSLCTFGDIDALYLIAAVRIYAEWRSIRMVPNGYKSYAFGVNFGRRDIIQNLLKIEKSVHSFLRTISTDNIKAIVLSSPTIEQLLLHEIESNAHPRLPRLSEMSGANGILWMKRQLQYQTFTFRNSQFIPEIFPSSKESALAAYNEIYGKYHGWSTQQVFRQSIRVAPTSKIILEHMDLPRVQLDNDVASIDTCDTDSTTSTMGSEISQEYSATIPKTGKSKVNLPNDVFFNDKSRKEHSVLSTINIKNSSIINKVECSRADISNDFLNEFREHITEKWQKIIKVVRTFDCLQAQNSFDEDNDDEKQVLLEPIVFEPKREPVPILESVNLIELEKKYISNNATSRGTIQDDIENHLSIMQPLLDEIGNTIEKLNMNDPARV